VLEGRRLLLRRHLSNRDLRGSCHRYPDADPHTYAHHKPQSRNDDAHPQCPCNDHCVTEHHPANDHATDEHTGTDNGADLDRTADTNREARGGRKRGGTEHGPRLDDAHRR
jgi:hypothetical protein